MSILKGPDNNYCLAKICYLMVLLWQMALITYKEVNLITVDYSEMSLYLAAVAATYFGRSHTKSK